MRLIKFAAIMALFAALMMPAMAQIEKDLKIGFVDLDLVTQKTKVIRKIVDDVEQELKKKQDEIDLKLKRYVELRDSLRKQETILTEEEIESRQKELRSLRNEIDDLQYEVNKKLRRSEREKIDPAVEKIMSAITALGKEKGYDLIVRSEVVLYGKDSCDLTDEVIQRLNAEGAEKKPEPTPPEKKVEGTKKESGTVF